MEYRVTVNGRGTFWFKPGTECLHREGAPAIEYANGSKGWYVNGLAHREDGPAFEYADGTKYWYLKGYSLTEKVFLEKTKPTKELTVNELETLLGYKIKVICQ